MTLTKDDKIWIKDAITDGVVGALNDIVIPRFEENYKRFDALESDVAELKADVSELKADVSELKDDVSSLKSDMRDVKATLHSLDDRVQLLESDVKEIYYMIADLQKHNTTVKGFAKLPLEEKILKAYSDILMMAKEAGITLPR